MTPNFWDLHYVLYVIGFLLVPRLTMIFIFSNYVTDGFIFKNFFLPITIWWVFPKLSLTFLNKAGFTFLLLVFPRLLLGIIGAIYLPDNRGFMIAACIIGVIIDIGAKVMRSVLKSDQSG